VYVKVQIRFSWSPCLTLHGRYLQTFDCAIRFTPFLPETLFQILQSKTIFVGTDKKGKDVKTLQKMGLRAISFSKLPLNIGPSFSIATAQFLFHLCIYYINYLALLLVLMFPEIASGYYVPIIHIII